MAFWIRNHSISSHFRSHSHSQNANDSLSTRSRGFHVEPGPREKALLADDPAISRFKSFKKSAANIKRIGDVLTIVVVAGCCYEIYVRATTREEARRKARESA